VDAGTLQEPPGDVKKQEGRQSQGTLCPGRYGRPGGA
jgi:hypothetical protein